MERGGAAMTQPARKIDPDAWERRDQRIGSWSPAHVEWRLTVSRLLSPRRSDYEKC